MPTKISENALMITSKGSVYHLDLKPEEVAENIITVGDPNRVKMVSKYFDKINNKKEHREFVTHTGRIGASRVSVISTGIGTDNIDIVLSELDALWNIDFKTKTVKKNITPLNIIRVGTAGALQASVGVDCIVVSNGAFGLDNLLHFYQQEDKKNKIEIALQKHLELPFKPYYAAGNNELLSKFKMDGFHHGITATCPGFFGPQGRALRLQPTIENLPEKLSAFSYEGRKILNFEMETAGIYGMANLMGHQACSLSAIVVNRATNKFSKDVNASIDTAIRSALDSLF